MIDTRSDQERQANIPRLMPKRTKDQERWYNRFGHLIPWNEPALVPDFAWKAAGMERLTIADKSV